MLQWAPLRWNALTLIIPYVPQSSMSRCLWGALDSSQNRTCTTQAAAPRCCWSTACDVHTVDVEDKKNKKKTVSVLPLGVELDRRLFPDTRDVLPLEFLFRNAWLMQKSVLWNHFHDCWVTVPESQLMETPRRWSLDTSSSKDSL